MGKPKRTTGRAAKAPAPAQDVQPFAKLVALLKDHPGRTAIELQHLGWRPETDGDLEAAEKAGRIVWVHKKWYAV